MAPHIVNIQSNYISYKGLHARTHTHTQTHAHERIMYDTHTHILSLSLSLSLCAKCYVYLLHILRTGQTK